MSSINAKLNEGPLRRERFFVPIKCDCGQSGAAEWEENAGVNPQGPQATLLNVSSGFYLRDVKKSVGHSEVVCAVCESILRD